MYELKQARRAWKKRIDGFLFELSFSKCGSEHGVYVKGSIIQDQFILYLYVNDLLVTSSKGDELAMFKASMENEFEMSNLGNLAYFVGMEIVNTRHIVFLHRK